VGRNLGPHLTEFDMAEGFNTWLQTSDGVTSARRDLASGFQLNALAGPWLEREDFGLEESNPSLALDLDFDF
jgi:hypothetical protein